MRVGYSIRRTQRSWWRPGSGGRSSPAGSTDDHDQGLNHRLLRFTAGTNKSELTVEGSQNSGFSSKVNDLFTP